MLLAIAVFVLHVPAEVVCAPNLQYPCINQLKQCLQSDNIAVSRLCFHYKIMMWIVQSLIRTHTLCSLSINYRNSVLNHLLKCTIRRKQLKCIIPVHGMHFLFRGWFQVLWTYLRGSSGNLGQNMKHNCLTCHCFSIIMFCIDSNSFVCSYIWPSVTL